MRCGARRAILSCRAALLALGMGFTEAQLDRAELSLSAKGYPPDWIDQELLFTEVTDPNAVVTVAGGVFGGGGGQSPGDDGVGGVEQMAGVDRSWQLAAGGEPVNDDRDYTSLG